MKKICSLWTTQTIGFVAVWFNVVSNFVREALSFKSDICASSRSQIKLAKLCSGVSAFLFLCLSQAQAQVLFSADFESTAGDNAFGPANTQWTVNPENTDTATTGIFERGNPTGTVYQPDITPSGDFAVVSEANNNSNGDADIDNGTISIRSPEITLPASATLELLISSYLSHSNATGGFFRITVEGSTSTIVYQDDATGTADIEDYVRRTFDISSFAGETITLLIEVSDNNQVVFYEAGFDDVVVRVDASDVSGFVRYDVDADGDLANSATEDRGLAGVNIEVFADNGSGAPAGTVLQTVVSEADGSFVLENLVDGDYVIVSGNLPGGISTADSEGLNDDQVLLTVAGNDVTGVLFLDTTDSPGLPETTAVYYFPYEESDILSSLDTINDDAADPVTVLSSISIAYPDTIILYDHWEDNGLDGYEDFPAAPRQSFTEVWGDGDLLNGVAPGFPDDILDEGDIIVLENTIAIGSSGSNIYFDARDKVSASRYVAITKAAWADVSETLLAGAWELYPTILWGTQFTLPIGEDLTDAEDAQAFEYTGGSVMSAWDNNEIRLNGALVATLDEGETFFWNGGLNVGDVLTTSRTVQLQLITGDINSNFESRWYTILPDSDLSNAYVAPTSTPNGNATLVWIYNNNSSSIDINVEQSDQASQILTVPAGEVVSFELTNGAAGRFISTNGEIFFALAAVDADNTDPNLNQTNDWGYSLVPEAFLSPTAVAGLAPGDDPNFVGAAENSAPLWLAAVFPVGSANYNLNRDADPDNDVQITVCIDYGGNGNVDDLATGGSDPITGRGFDLQVTLDELEQEIIYVDLDEDGDPDVGADQTGTRIWVCDGSDAVIALAYGQDPNTASGGSPAVDFGTTIPAIPVLGIAKDVAIETDLNGNGYPEIGDILRYTIILENTGTASFPTFAIEVFDNLNQFLDYVPNTTELTDISGTVLLEDDTVGTVFPIDNEGTGGYNYPPVLIAGNNFELTFLAEVSSLPAD